MEQNKVTGILSIILGLIFIIFPIISTGTISIMMGLSLLFFGLALIFTDFSARNLLIGIIAIIFGLLFMFSINGLSFIIGLQFYIIGIIMIAAGISGIVSPGMSKLTSIMIILLGIIQFALAGLSMAQPLYAAILIGLSLIIQGISVYLNS
ncbi:MAG: DUF308 domain-containing protein [Methanosphaera sp.]|uniref:DUF308 domain-containing protein n=1 Tax=Methanosphaera sp. ISO3-F5 TaxID=1452353 RepID=UPI002B2593CB|nr:DUF308 domain-containing protein [Methanosphaera sp. ISO3-F5]MBR0473134.1 DUF308 domain-containing protein [Methanosphaera sp.]WQH64561.1 DUF308 domain-containing protein [Methanosphaera sp. ISO3-F5]